jgi:hypothetical protein
LLFSAGLDGLIAQFNLEEFRNSALKIDAKNVIFNSQGGNSIFSISTDYTGKLLLCSIYENVVLFLK